MIDGYTQLYGIIGNPARHSLSPIIHNGAFRRMGINAAYLAFEVKDLEAAVEGIRGLGIRGMSVTMPFKSAIIPFLDHLEEGAIRVQSVNTVLNEGGRLVGYSTDGAGAIEALEGKVDLSGKKILLLGAGGAARAIAFGLIEKGCQVTIANRSVNKGWKLAREIGGISLTLPFQVPQAIAADVIINATSVGMYPNDTLSPIPKDILRKEMAVMDIVYQPLRTRLLAEAEESGCLTLDGLEMLARQGAAQFQIWTGQRPDLGEIKKDLLRALK
jgi:shikimate dehydrogenase